MTTRASEGGLEPRFIIERADGKPIDPSRRYCMVLDFSGADPWSVVAAEAYAVACEAENPALATDIRQAIANPADAPAQHRYASVSA
ncbi:hypothetical protein Pam5_29 [Pseudanabaena phage Pam5]|nr:hypothetical protein Pam5_29 [Pseudanabaena phage Pam5]